MKFKLLNILSLILFAFQPVLVQGQDNKQDVKPNDGPAQEGAKATDENEENTAGPLAGHSYHGEAFNEGPRQQAYLIPGMANVDFPITTKNIKWSFFHIFVKIIWSPISRFSNILWRKYNIFIIFFI